MRFETVLQDEIVEELEQLGKMTLGTEEYRGAVDGLAKLMDKAIEAKRLTIEHNDKVDIQQEEYNLKVKQMSDEQKDRWVKDVIAVLGIVIPTAATIWGTIKSIEFEKEGTITTIMGRGFIQKLLPKK